MTNDEFKRAALFVLAHVEKESTAQGAPMPAILDTSGKNGHVELADAQQALTGTGVVIAVVSPGTYALAREENVARYKDTDDTYNKLYV